MFFDQVPRVLVDMAETVDGIARKMGSGGHKILMLGLSSYCFAVISMTNPIRYMETATLFAYLLYKPAYLIYKNAKNRNTKRSRG